MSRKTLLIFIHGGGTYADYESYINDLKSLKIESLDYFRKVKWKNRLAENLGDQFEVIMPDMPNKQNAKYAEWKIYFDKILDLVQCDYVLVGHSLGGIFLAKYLNENTPRRTPRKTILIAAPFGSESGAYSLADFELGDDLHALTKNAGRLVLIFSKDDPAVSFESAIRYKKMLPEARFIEFSKKGHFVDESFPEIFDLIREF
jgi:predicted alpha/beta hydrolase family esterase